MNLTDVSTDQLRSALQIKEQIESLEQQLNSLLSGSARIQSSTHPSSRRNGRRTMSASARARIAAAQRARWAKLKRNSSKIQSSKNPSIRAGKPRRMSAAGRARIIAATKARWARFHAARK